MTIPVEFLERLRACVRISEVATRIGVRYKKEGSEFVVVGNNSLKFNDKKRVWKDHGNGEKGGDVIAFLQTQGNRTFHEAVEELAALAGLSVPGSRPNGDGSTRRSNGEPEGHGAPVSGVFREGSWRQGIPVGTWSYAGLDGREIYQTVRLQWKLSDGSWEKDQKTGKAKKTFYQRRRTPHVDGCWINGLKVTEDSGEPLLYMRKGPGSDWRRYDEKSYREWHFSEKASFEQMGDVAHTLLCLPEIMEALQEERQDQRTIFLPEGEKKVDLLRSWGCLATCNSGGAQNWHDGMATLLHDAADIVILEDNDDAGRARTLKIGASLQKAGCRVRCLSLPGIWPKCPEKGDVVDWADAGGDREALFRAVRELPEWTAPPYRSKYNAHTWGAAAIGDIHAYDWTVKGLMPARQVCLIMGPSGSGKSFETTSMALHVARGVMYRGKRVRQGGVVYLAYEAGLGLQNRLAAYRKHHSIHPGTFIPFAWLTKPPGLFAKEDAAVALADDINALTADWVGPHKLSVIVVDTHNAATRGSSEIKTEDINKVMDRYYKLAELTGAAIWVIGHTNSSGNHRGSEVLFNAIETCILIEKIKGKSHDEKDFVEDEGGNVMRRIKVRKQREGLDNWSQDFILQKIYLGIDADGEHITSMVPAAPGAGTTAEDKYKKAWTKLSNAERVILQVLSRATEVNGVPTPDGLELPRSVRFVVKADDFQKICAQDAPMLTIEDIRKGSRDLKAGGWVGFRNGYMWRVREDKSVIAAPPVIMDEATGRPIGVEDL